MTSSTAQQTWEIFCKVVDNYGDIGVCWRLARQLVNEYAFSVRLWVDDMSSFQRICPEIEPQLPRQHQRGVEIRRWESEFPAIIPGDVVIESFACHLPQGFIQAMSERKTPPVWVNLDYLSAEHWVETCHTLPSPHPNLPLTKYFFFPGFSARTGGLLREASLEAQRRMFLQDQRQQQAFWNQLGQGVPSPEALRISLFCYENPVLPDVLRCWQNGTQAICCLSFAGQAQQSIEAFAGQSLPPGAIFRRGKLEIRLLPFLEQGDYDRLLWLCDLNFVRGEDSFLRAQWAGKPMLWQIYPQEEDAHCVKLDAFLDRYCATLPATQALIMRQLYARWNSGQSGLNAESWEKYRQILPELALHAHLWKENQSKQADLCAALVRFCQSKV